MKIKTKRQLLLLLILVNFVIFTGIGIACKYYFDLDILAPLGAASVVGILLQYNLRKNQLPQA